MEKIEIQQIPEKYHQEIKARVQGSIDPLLSGHLEVRFWRDLEKEAKEKGRVLISKERYFFNSFENGLIDLRSGTYRDFAIALRLFGDLEKSGLAKASESVFNNPQIKSLGLQNLLTTSDGYFVFGKRSDKVQQAPGYFCLPAGGVTAEQYPEDQRNNPDVYLGSQNQIRDELGINVNQEDLHLTCFSRDTGGSPNTSMVFEANLSMGKKDILDYFNHHAADKWEHDFLQFLSVSKTYEKLAKGAFDTKMIGASLGAIINSGRRNLGEDWYSSTRDNLPSSGYKIADKDQ